MKASVHIFFSVRVKRQFFKIYESHQNGHQGNGGSTISPQVSHCEEFQQVHLVHRDQDHLDRHDYHIHNDHHHMKRVITRNSDKCILCIMLASASSGHSPPLWILSLTTFISALHEIEALKYEKKIPDEWSICVWCICYSDHWSMVNMWYTYWCQCEWEAAGAGEIQMASFLIACNSLIHFFPLSMSAVYSEYYSGICNQKLSQVSSH